MPFTHRPVAPLLLLLACLVTLLAGCEGNLPFTIDPDGSKPRGADYVTSEPIGTDDFDALWERAKMRLGPAGYGVDPDRTSRADRLIVSGWRTQLAPSRYKGNRRRVWIRFEGEEGAYIAAVAVQTQRNTEMSEPLNPMAADWEDDEPDLARAGVLAYQIESDFR